MKHQYKHRNLLLWLVVLATSLKAFAQTTVTLPAACNTCPSSVTPCTPPTALVCDAATTISAGGTATSTVTGGTGGTITWAITPTAGVSSASGSGSTTGAITFTTAGTYTVTFTSTNSTTPAACSPAASVTCTRTITVNAVGAITALNCATATNTGTLTSGTAASSVSSSVPYTGGNGGPYSAVSVTSTGVTGLTASIAAGTFASGAGNLTVNITGTPSAAGTASFALTIGGQSCTLTRTVTAPAGTVTAFNCAAAIPSPGGYSPDGTAYSGTASLAYTGGNGGSYAAGSVASTGITGFTATWAAGSFATGAGSITINITGSSTTAGVAAFPISIGGQSCTIYLYGCGAYVAAGVFKAFLCHNLGANTSLDPHNMAQTNAWGLNGAYIQWGRRGPNTTGDSRVDWITAGNTSNFAAAPTGSTAATANSDAIAGWSLTAAANNSWRTTAGAKTANDPCPAGWRVPTSTEWTGVNSNNTVSRTSPWGISGPTQYGNAIHFGPNSTTKFLTLPATGRRNASDGVLQERGTFGTYWSSTESTNALDMTFDAFNVAPANNSSRLYGQSIRCIAE